MLQLHLFVAISLASVALCDLIGVPTLPFSADGHHGTFSIDKVHSIILDKAYANATDTDGWTLIPPTLSDFTHTFQDDLEALTGRHITLVEQHGEVSDGAAIRLTLGNCSDFIDAAGRWTSEAYQLDVGDGYVTIIGASPLGIWWGTRSVLQQLVLNNGSLPTGKGVDSPGWNTRGIFLDAGRHYYPPSFIVEMCNWLSYWKQNTFHLHLSDNLYNNPNYTHEQELDLYARFRMLTNDSTVAGLNTHVNESYTRQDFDEVQHGCAARGVTIIPEIEAPGHALVISQWKPQLGLDGTLDLLNISYPDTIPTMETIWRTFLPWFHSKAVHIGADEYTSDELTQYELAQAYNKFVNTMDDYIGDESGKSMRIWGTFPPQANYTDNISTNVTIQHWEFFEDYPLQDYVANGYSVINSDDTFYIVNKYSGSYGQVLNKTPIFHGNPLGGAFAPYVFDTNNASNNPPKNSPYVLGHIAAQWNDYGPNTSTYLEAYYSWRDYLPALADKQWGGKLTEKQYDAVFETLQAAAPAQNLDRTIPSQGSTILEYDFRDTTTATACHNNIHDLSGNSYDGWTNCATTNGTLTFANNCSLHTPLTSKGRNYTLTFNLLLSTNAPAPLFRGPDSELWSGNGSSTQIMLISAGNAFALNYSLPIGEWSDVSLIGRGNQTFFSVEGGEEMEFTSKIGVNGEFFEWVNMAVVAPLATIGGEGLVGRMRGVKLVDHA